MLLAVFTAILFVINFFWTNYFLVILQGILAMILFLLLAHEVGSLEDKIQRIKLRLENQSREIELLKLRIKKIPGKENNIQS